MQIALRTPLTEAEISKNAKIMEIMVWGTCGAVFGRKIDVGLVLRTMF